MKIKQIFMVIELSLWLSLCLVSIEIFYILCFKLHLTFFTGTIEHYILSHSDVLYASNEFR